MNCHYYADYNLIDCNRIPYVSAWNEKSDYCEYHAASAHQDEGIAVVQGECSLHLFYGYLTFFFAGF